MAPRINSLYVKNLRSVGEPVSIRFPEQGALVLLGENNAGKSNITRAIDILFGDMWPGSRQMEEHDFHGRDSDGIAIEISAQVSGISCSANHCGGQVTHLIWKYDPQGQSSDGSPVTYRFRCSVCTKAYPNREMRAALASTTLDADRRLDYQLSYASKYTMLSKLMHRFHERLLADPQRKQRLAEDFSSLVDKFRGVPEFAEFERVLSETAEDFGQNLPYRLDVDFSAYDPSNFFRSLRVRPTFSEEARSFDELGTGQSQVLALAFAYAYAKAYGKSEGMVLVIDEPEANLHPLAQQWLASRLNNLVTDGLQIVLTTHSPHFVNLARPENLVLVKKSGGEQTQAVQCSQEEMRTRLVERGANPERTQASTVGPFYAASATTEIVSGLFARRCVLVEGATEALALPDLLRLHGLDVLREGIAVVPVGGIGNIAKWYRFYTAFGIECFCVFDTDSDKTGKDASNLLTKRQDIMAALNLDGSLAETAAMSSDPLWVEETFATLNPNFEGATTALFDPHWSQLFQEAAPIVGESKPLQARYAAQRTRPCHISTQSRAVFTVLVQRIRGGLTAADGEAVPDEPWQNASADPWEDTAPAPQDDHSDPWSTP